MPHVTYIISHPLTVKVYLKPQFQALVSRNWRVSVICGGDQSLLPQPEELPGVEIYHVAMRREIDPVTDCLALVQIFFLLTRLRPAIVNAGTPKAGLLGMIASRLAHIPVRIYQLHGLRLETTSGWRRRLFLLTERCACWCSHKVLCVSASLRDKAVELGVCTPDKAAVLGAGSCVGIHVADYIRTAERITEALLLKRRLGIPQEAPVVGFIGRLTKDKGIVELWDAFTLIRRKISGAYLLLIGPLEDGDPIPQETRQQIKHSEHTRHIAWTDDPRPYLHLMDVLVLPTHREGLPGVLLEAAASEIPIVATQATGVIDVVVNEETGLIGPVGDAPSIAQNVLKVLENPGLSRELCRRARQKVEAEYSRGEVLQHLESFYTESLFRCGKPESMDHCGFAGTP